MNRPTFKIAASTVILALTMGATTAQSEALRQAGAGSAAESRNGREAAQLHEQARRALVNGAIGDALTAMEEAVVLSPRDAGYRLLLGDIYMKSGRFESARATYADVLELDTTNVRAGLSLALMQIALGRPAAAVAQLDALDGRAAAADLGLAYALAGYPQRAIEILEPAARAIGASSRLRQNLALSYALAGDWSRARTVAAQDISPAALGARMQQWAAMARPGTSGNTQVATLLGVTPVHDAGQPVRVALAPPAPAAAPAAEEVMVAAAQVDGYPTYAAAAIEAAAPAAVSSDSDWGQPASPADPVPVQVAEEASSYYLPATTAPAAQSEEQARHAAAAQTLVTPEPAVVQAAASVTPAPVFRRAAPQPVTANVNRGESRFVVQLGAFSNEGNAERAWQQAEQRFGLDGQQPLTTTITLNGRTLHRVSVAGFATQGDAVRLCGAIRARGGSCFVRANAGDASVRWAARYAPGRNQDA
jgi:Flp pilus assembly protein TadD/cell division protein FtsN